jgi:hypothetical protein
MPTKYRDCRGLHRRYRTVRAVAQQRGGADGSTYSNAELLQGRCRRALGLFFTAERAPAAKAAATLSDQTGAGSRDLGIGSMVAVGA